ncbi:MAG: SpoIIE family protein phosphatase [Lachnospiraceae bacterium]|nr:SpoIIE family protein phosphatase [Lachnospiraceae bacterium]
MGNGNGFSKNNIDDDSKEQKHFYENFKEIKYSEVKVRGDKSYVIAEKNVANESEIEKEKLEQIINDQEKLKRKIQLMILIGLTVMYGIVPFTKFGFIFIGDFSITFIQVPIILVTILIGLPQGFYVSLLFGLSSMGLAYNVPSDSFDALFRNPYLSVVPRLLIPLIAWAAFAFFKRLADDYTISAKLICGALSSVCGVLANTLFVLIALIIVYPVQMGLTADISSSTLILSHILGPNMIAEIFVAVILTCIVILASEKAKEKLDIIEFMGYKPLRKSFQKWILLFTVVGFCIMLSFLYQLLTEQDLVSANRLLSEKNNDISNQVSVSKDSIENEDLEIGNSGYILLIENNVVTKSCDVDMVGKSLSDLGIKLSDVHTGKMFYIVINGTSGEAMYMKSGRVTVFSFLSDSEIYVGRNRNTSILLAGVFVLFILIYLTITRIVQRNVVHKIYSINESLEKIRGGDLDEYVNVVGNTEFEELSLGINTTVAALRDTMEEIATRDREEMEFAREIQYSTLPKVEHFQPENGEYEVRGMMITAREVGGDFFDLYTIGKNKLGLLIADVSGKGVPAALFMMTSKTLIKNLTLSGKKPAEVLEIANNELVENNERGMFVTVWLGIIDLQEGTLEFANAAHNPPLLKKKNELSVYMDHRHYKRSLMLGCIEGTEYFNNVIEFTKGDALFLYTDGITEAHSETKELYGEDRLQICFEKNFDKNLSEILDDIHDDINKFAGKAEQFDDITMLAIKMRE